MQLAGSNVIHGSLVHDVGSELEDRSDHVRYLQYTRNWWIPSVSWCSSESDFHKSNCIDYSSGLMVCLCSWGKPYLKDYTVGMGWGYTSEFVS